jgi:hypothetical protein
VEAPLPALVDDENAAAQEAPEELDASVQA